MRCGLSATDHVIEHLCPVLGLRCTRPGQWSGPCPVCHGPRRLSVAVKSGRELMCCHRAPPCEKSAIRTVLIALLPGCYQQQRAGRRIEPESLIALATADMPPTSLRLALLELAGMSTPDALDKLGIRRENRSRVIASRHQY